ncbi:uncharacterized protein TNCT_19671 [Trichonephila clavata]|uniref:Uncharacterized protein n=1 Tax=Trichonephila clavata TaxID=2740835 RepID=A0A8X6KXA6_TRICU|nr:uncharacterized protein TNCT_19671 [Trichonephila clavata]
MLSNIPVTISPHANLNFSRGVISESDSYNVPEQEILEGLREQKVCEVRRITIRRDGQIVNTKHLILTFACPDLPQTITAGYLRCSVYPYIPNPLRCFQCQGFGHSKTTCRGKATPSGGSPSLAGLGSCANKPYNNSLTRPWTVPGSTLCWFPCRLALKNPPVVTLGTLEKCGNSGSGGGPDGTGRIRAFAKNGDNK